MRGARIGSLQDEERALAGGGAGNPGRRGAVQVSEELGKVVSKQVWKQRAARVVPIFIITLLILTPRILGENLSVHPSSFQPPSLGGRGRNTEGTTRE